MKTHLVREPKMSMVEIARESGLSVSHLHKLKAKDPEFPKVAFITGSVDRMYFKRSEVLQWIKSY